MKKITAKLTAFALVFILFASTLIVTPTLAKDIDAPSANFGVIADTHYYPESYVNLNSQKYLSGAYSEGKFMGESPAVLRAALETIAVRKEQGTYNMGFLLVPGDLTFAGEIAGHMETAALFEAFEARTGIQVFVINGNHDVNNYNAVNYAVSDEDDPQLIVSPEAFKDIYADFGYAQADSIFTPSTGKAGMLSYAVSLPGNYRLIAIDACRYSADVTEDGLDRKEGGIHMSPELTDWVLQETTNAALQGETVLGMIHFSLIPHFELESTVSADDMLENHEGFAYALADAGMHFAFTGHVHSNDTASIVSANNNILYDIETAALANIPNIYREVSFSTGLEPGQISCTLNNVACDAESQVDVSGASDKYGLIEKPFSENYCWPMLYGGSIEKGIRSDAAEFLSKGLLTEIPKDIRKALPTGLAGLLKEQGFDLGEKMTKASPSLKRTLSGYNLSGQAFSQFLAAIVKQIDDKYILNTTHTSELLNAVVTSLARFEIEKGNSATEFGKMLLLCLEYHTVGDEDARNNPEIQLAIDALHTQAGADRLVAKLIDIILNDVLFNDILPSISLNDLDTLLPAGVMANLRAVAGDDLTAGGVLDKILDTTAMRMNALPFVNIDSGRDLTKALVYTIGYQYLNAGERLKMAGGLADIFISFTTDTDPAFLGDSMVTLHTSPVNIVPSTSNFRLPADMTVTKGNATGEAVVSWYTIQGIQASDIELSPLPAFAEITKTVELQNKTVKVFDFGVTKIKVPRTLLKHTVTISGLETGVEYSFKAGDQSRDFISMAQTLTLASNGNIEQGEAGSDSNFLKKLADFFADVFVMLKSVGTIVRFFV